MLSGDRAKTLVVRQHDMQASSKVCSAVWITSFCFIKTEKMYSIDFLLILLFVLNFFRVGMTDGNSTSPNIIIILADDMVRQLCTWKY